MTNYCDAGPASYGEPMTPLPRFSEGGMSCPAADCPVSFVGHDDTASDNYVAHWREMHSTGGTVARARAEAIRAQRNDPKRKRKRGYPW